MALKKREFTPESSTVDTYVTRLNKDCTFGFKFHCHTVTGSVSNLVNVGFF